jgi:hypothetical protein
MECESTEKHHSRASTKTDGNVTRSRASWKHAVPLITVSIDSGVINGNLDRKTVMMVSQSSKIDSFPYHEAIMIFRTSSILSVALNSVLAARKHFDCRLPAKIPVTVAAINVRRGTGLINNKPIAIRVAQTVHIIMFVRGFSVESMPVPCCWPS